jgi:hypothetical protein
MRFRIAFCLLGILAVMASVAMAADVAGKWIAQMPGRDGQTREVPFTFQVDGDKLTGTTAGRDGDIPIADGKINGDEISFTITRSMGGNEMKFLYKGKVAGDEIKFTMTMDGGDRPPREFVAKKAK